MSPVRFTVLGPVAMIVDGQRHTMPRAQTRGLLAFLLLNVGRPVSREAVTEAVWGGAEPATARSQIHNAMRTIRTTLARLGAPNAISSGPYGYQATIDRELIDLARFEALLRDARRDADSGAPDRAAAAMRDGLALWQGEPLQDAGGAFVEAARAQLVERRLTAIEELADLELRLGRASAVVADLAPVVHAHPLRERVRARYMTALSHCGRQAEALAAFRAYRTRLAEEQGLDPGREIAELERAILRGELAPTPPAAATPMRPSAVPAQLPLDLHAFSGRTAELGRLEAAVAAARTGDNATIVLAVCGTAGVGKTTLAVHWARRHAQEFPDGQLYVNLHGFDAGGPMGSAEAVRGLLDGLGVPPQRVPPDLAAQAALYRSLLDGRRVLVVLDNAADAGQVRPLLPGAPGCLAVVTSRAPLQSLVAAEGAIPVALDLLGASEARDLLVRRVGADRVGAEPAAVAEIIAATAGLPLALALVAARAATAPDTALTAIADQLRRARGSLAALRSDDPATDPGAVFSWSYRTASPAAGRLFRLLGLHPGPDVSVPAAASLAGLPVDQVGQLLVEIERASLIRESAPGRYTSHDLLRAYAHELTLSTDSATDRGAAVHRMLDHYLHTGMAAAMLVYPMRDPYPLAPVQDGVSPEEIADRDAALAWFAAERPVFLAAIRRNEAGFEAYTWQLAWAIADFLDYRGLWLDIEAMYGVALVAAGRLGDPFALGQAHRGVARAYGRLGKIEDSLAHYREAYRYFGLAGDLIGQARMRINMGRAYGQQGRYEEALAEALRGLELFEAARNPAGVGQTLGVLGWYCTHLGRHAEAVDYCRRAIAIHQELGRTDDEMASWDSLGVAQHALGQYDEAVASYQRSLDMIRRTGSNFDEATVLEHLGETHVTAGDPRAARAAWTLAQELYRDLGHPNAAVISAKLSDLPAWPGHEGAARGGP